MPIHVGNMWNSTVVLIGVLSTVINLRTHAWSSDTLVAFMHSTKAKKSISASVGSSSPVAYHSTKALLS